MGPSGGSPGLSCDAYEGDPAAMVAFLQPLVDWADAAGGTVTGSASAHVSWNNTMKPIADITDREAVPNHGIVCVGEVSLPLITRKASPLACAFRFRPSA